ncbi:hypothetical protein H4217_006994 [Coemansia sp. RSA 1939]|nr:hypothetical protein H4217_006994 [Coemansia sp. RSA 1939]
MQPDSNYYQSQVPQPLMLSVESPMLGYQKRKIKCSGTRPICDHCLRRGIQCIYKPLARTPRRTVSAGSGGGGGGGNSQTTPASRNSCRSPSNRACSGNGAGGVQPISIPTPNSNSNSANPFLSPLVAASAYNTGGGGGHHDIASAPAFHSLSPLLGYGGPGSGIAKTPTHDSSSSSYSHGFGYGYGFGYGHGGRGGPNGGSLPKRMCDTPTAIPPHMYNSGGGGGGGRAVDVAAMHSYSPLAFGPPASLGGDIAGTPGSLVSSIQSDFPPDSPSPYPGGLFGFNQTMLAGYNAASAPMAATPPASAAKKNGGHRLFAPRGDKGCGGNDDDEDDDENESLLSMSAIDGSSNNHTMMADFLGLQMDDPTATMYSDSGGAAAAAALSASMYEFQIPVDPAAGGSGSHGSEQSHHQLHFPPPHATSASFHHGMAAFSLPNQFSAIPAAATIAASGSVGSFRPGMDGGGRQRRATGDSNDSISSMPLLERSAMMGGDGGAGLHGHPDPSRPSNGGIAASSRGGGGVGGVSDGILGYYFSSAQQQGYAGTAAAGGGGGGGIAPGLTIYQNAAAESSSMTSTNIVAATTTTTTLERGGAFDGGNGYPE